MRRAEALGEAVARRRARRHRRHARQDDHDGDDHGGARRGRARAHRRRRRARRQRGAGTCAPASERCSSSRPTSTTARSSRSRRRSPSSRTSRPTTSTSTPTSPTSAARSRSSSRGARYVVLCADDAGANALPTPSDAPRSIRYGTALARRAAASRRDLRGPRAAAPRSTVVYDGETLGEVELARARACTTCATRWPRSPAGSRSGVDGRRDARRASRRSAASSAASSGSARWTACMVVDDYAHHPTEIARHARRGAQRAFPAGGSSPRSSRTCSRARATSRASSARRSRAADVVFLADIYPAREQPMPGVTQRSRSPTRCARRAGPRSWRGARERARRRARARGARRATSC